MTNTDDLTHYMEATSRMRARAEAAETEVERLRANVGVLERELDRERGLFPADGVWLVTGERSNSQRIAKLGEVPDPIAFAALARHRDAIAAAVSRCWTAYQESGSQAPIDVADAILRDLQRTLARDQADLAMSNKTRAQAFSEWFYGSHGNEPAMPDVGMAFRAGWDAHAADVEPVIAAAREAIRAQGPDYGKKMLALTDALIAFGQHKAS